MTEDDDEWEFGVTGDDDEHGDDEHGDDEHGDDGREATGPDRRRSTDTGWETNASDDGEATWSDDDATWEEPTTSRGGDGDPSSTAPWARGDDATGGGLRALLEVLVLIVVAVVTAGIFVFGGAFAMFAAYGTTDVGTVPLLLVSLLGSQFAFAGVAYGYTRWRGDPLSAIGLRAPTVKEWGLVLAGTVAAFVLALVASIAVQTLGLQAAENSTATTAAEVPSSLLVLIPVAIFVIGPCEELLFRGAVQRRLRQVSSAPVAIVVSGALFAGVHVIALAGSPSAMLTTVGVLFFPTLVFGVLYEYTENVVVTALVHGLYDAVLFGLLYVSLTYAPEAADGGSEAVVAVLATVP